MDTQIQETTVTNYSTKILYKCGRSLEVHMLPDGTFKIHMCFSQEDWRSGFTIEPKQVSANEVDIKVVNS